MAALCVAKRLGRKMSQIDYAQVISKYPGDTAKAIRGIFAAATASNSIIFMDEADSLLSKRIDLSQDNQACSASINQNRNTMLNCLDQFDGVVVMATNFFRNFDEAFIRRSAQWVEFKKPTSSMLAELYKRHLPGCARVSLTETDILEVAEYSVGFSGGDVLNVVLNAVSAASLPQDTAQWSLTKSSLTHEVNAIKTAKSSYADEA